MMIEVSRAEKGEQPILEHLMELYLYDFAEFDGADVGPDGCYGYPRLASYWAEAGRDPYLLRVDGNLAGFALVFEYSLLGAEGRLIAEFFVMRKYRGRGAGKAMAFQLFDRYPGHWEISQIRENVSAQQFWRKIIGEYTHGGFREVWLDNEDWVGPVQTFENGPSAENG